MKKSFPFKLLSISVLFWVTFFWVEKLTAQNCNNVTEGGMICCNQSSTIAPYDPNPILSVQPASGGGNAAIEYMWMYTNDPYNTVFSTWNGVPNSNFADYDPGPVSMTTFYVRCARRAGCADFVTESNVVVVTVPSCTDLNSGGKIAANQSACGPTFDPAIITSVTPALGVPGAPPIQYAWYKSNVLEIFNTSTGHWMLIPNATGESYDPDDISQTTYYVRVASRDGCPTRFASNILKVDVFPAPKATANIVNPFCSGDSNGSIQLSYTGGTPPFALKWADPNIPLNTFNLSNLKAGIYGYTLTDARGCQEYRQLELKEPLALQVDASGKDIGCYGNNDGSASVVVSGGTIPYQYLWTNNANTASIGGLAPGVYRVTVTDANGCSKTDELRIVQPDSLSITSGHSDLLCYASADGVASAIASGGLAPYSYLWSNGQTDATISGLTAGTYSVSVTDKNTCMVSTSLEIVQPDSFKIKSVVLDNRCFGDKLGSISVTVSGGTGAYDYRWSNGGKNASLSALSSGSYVLTITDENLCKIVSTYVVREPVSLQATVNSVSVTCNGSAEGAASVTISGGTPPYDVIWSTGSTTTSIANLPSGTYGVTVTDANQCKIEKNVTVAEPGRLSLRVTVKDESCSDKRDGSVEVGVEGGILPYSFVWSSGHTDSDIDGLAPGDYWVTVTDKNQCLKIAKITIKAAAPIVLQFTTEASSCYGTASGKIFTSVSGAVPPIRFSWSNGSSQKDLENLISGTYFLTVTDGRGCTQTGSAFVSQPGNPLKVEIYTTAALCFGGSGSAYVVPSGGTAPFNYLWSTGQTTSSINGLLAGAYAVTVYDSKYCAERGDLVIDQPAKLQADISFQNISCYGYQNGTATASAVGGKPPYSFEWSSGQQVDSIFGLSAGNYTVTIADENGCTAINSVNITEPEPLRLVATGSNIACYGAQTGTVSVIVLGGGVSPFDYQWSNGSTTSTLSAVAAGSYSVTVTDVNRCLAAASVVVTQSPDILLTIKSVDVKCRGQKSGSATAEAFGGSGLYSYIWSGGQTTASVNQLAPGTYFVTVTDSYGCTKSSYVTIYQPDGFMINVLKKEISCFNGGDGSAVVVLSGSPAGQVGFIWSNGETGYAIYNLSAGVYAVKATDQNGCTANADFTLNNPGRIQFDVLVKNIPCRDNGKGSATVTNVSGGQAPYSYIWSEGSSTAAAYQLSEGSYSVTVMDTNGCSEVKTIFITQPTAIVCQAIMTAPVTNYNGNQGAATVTASGGVQPYTYLWSTAETTASITGLTSGVYVVLVSDANACTCTSLVKIPNKSRLGDFVWDDVNADGIQQPAEPGLADVKVTLSGSMNNGTPVSRSTLSDASGYYIFDGLMAGKYKLTFERPSGYYVTGKDNGADDLDSDVDPLTGMTGIYDLSDGESNISIDAGFVKSGRLGDKVWFDKNKNGIQDSGEPEFANIVVKLFLTGPDNVFRTADDLLAQATSTDNSGMYYFADVERGQKYMIQFDISSVPAGYVFTSANAGSDDSTDSDVDVQGFSHVIMLMPSQQEDLSIDAGLFAPCNNVDEGGLIGPRERTFCGPTVVPAFNSISPASGGSSAPIEYLWLKSTTNPFFVPNSSDWDPIPGSNTPALSPGLVTTTTYFIRCARRQGCDPYTAESNIVTVFIIDPPKAEINLFPRIDVCVLNSVNFAATDAGLGAAYNWNFGASSVPQSANGITAAAFFNATGNFRITLTVSKSGCSSKDYVNVNVVNCPSVGSRFGFSDIKMITVGPEKVALSWRTSDARYDNLFIVEHSKNGLDFNSIGTVVAKDLLNSGFYTFDDFNPSMGYNYYRIRHIDYFSTSVYSEKLNNFLTNKAADTEAAVYPNPVTDFIKFEISKRRTLGAKVDVISAFGQSMLSSKMSEGQLIGELDVSELAGGYYFVRIDFGGGKIETHKIIVQK